MTKLPVRGTAVQARYIAMFCGSEIHGPALGPFILNSNASMSEDVYGSGPDGPSRTGTPGGDPDSLHLLVQSLRQITGGSRSTAPGTEVVYLSIVATPLGPMLLSTTDAAVCLLEYVDRPTMKAQLRRMTGRQGTTFLDGPNEVGERLEQELAGYFAGDVQSFLTPLRPSGTEFQQRVWSALLEIPYGETRTYGQQARMIGESNAVRAVARANGDNRIAIVIPCHRVIGANGALTGYGGGLWRKRWLLDLEQGEARPEAQTELPLA